MKISQRKDGRFGTQIRTPDGKYKTVYGKTAKDCRQKAYDLIAEIEDGKYVKVDKQSFSQWAEDWEKSYLINIGDGTKREYKNALKCHLTPVLGAKKLQSIKKKDIQQLITDLHEEKELSAKTVKNIHGVLHRCLNNAIDAGIIKENPATGIILPKREKPEIYPLSETDIPHFMELINGDWYENIYKFLLFTGLRISELCGLTRDRIKGNNITIDRQLVSTDPITFAPPKHNKKRTISISDTALNIIKVEKAKQAKIKLAVGSQELNPYDFVFTTDYLEPLSKKSVYCHLKVITKKDFPELRLHDLRHTYAVLSLQAGVDIKTIQENLGHHTAAFTLDQYAYVTDKMRVTAAEKLEKYVNSYVK